MMNSKITLKLQSQTKTKRVRELPKTFQALLALADNQIKEEREVQQQLNESFHRLNSSFLSGRDFSIRYVDGDQELINVSDDEDLLTAYEVAEKDLNGNLKLTVSLKQASAILSQTGELKEILDAASSGFMTERVVSKPLLEPEDKKVEEDVNSVSLADKAAETLSKKALKKALKDATKEQQKKEKEEAKALKELQKKEKAEAKKIKKQEAEAKLKATKASAEAKIASLMNAIQK